MEYNIDSKNWWRNNLSINEQKSYAKKHLSEYDASMLIGSHSQYTSTKKQDELIMSIWIAEDKPHALKPEGFTWK